MTGGMLENTLLNATYCVFELDTTVFPACMQVFSICRIRSSCEIHLQKFAVRVLKLARTHANFCGEHDGVVEF